jgi:hypothetical protein
MTPIFSRDSPSCSFKGAVEVGGIELAALYQDFADSLGQVGFKFAL